MSPSRPTQPLPPSAKSSCNRFMSKKLEQLYAARAKWILIAILCLVALGLVIYMPVAALGFVFTIPIFFHILVLVGIFASCIKIMNINNQICLIEATKKTSSKQLHKNRFQKNTPVTIIFTITIFLVMQIFLFWFIFLLYPLLIGVFISATISILIVWNISKNS